MLGAGFTRILRAAQAGDEAAFVRLWRDANPAMTRYLRVAGVDDPYDAACEGWITVVRGLPGFQGDETAWRVWLLACARMRAEEGSLRRTWGSVTVLPGPRPRPGAEPIEVDDLEPTGDPEHRGVGEAIAAIRSLPLGQGEVLMLRLCAELPEPAVADVVGTDVAGVRRTEARALERLQVDRELLAWSLSAPATPAELADERVVTGAFRSLPRPGARGGARVIAVGTRQAHRPSRPRAKGVGGLSRSALVGVAAVSASVVSLGGISAAAWNGSLPAPVQQVLHDAIGAPAPAHGDGAAPGRDGTRGPDGVLPGRGGRSDTPGAPAHPTGSPTAPVPGGKAASPSRGGSSTGSPTRTATHTAPGSPTRTGTHPANPRSTQSGRPTTQHSGKGQTQGGSPTSKPSGKGQTQGRSPTSKQGGAEPAPTTAPASPTTPKASGQASGRTSGDTSGTSSQKGSSGRAAARTAGAVPDAAVADAP